MARTAQDLCIRALGKNSLVHFVCASRISAKGAEDVIEAEWVVEFVEVLKSMFNEHCQQ